MKSRLFVLAMTALAATACVQEQQEQNEASEAQTITLTAYQPGYDSTRTMVEDGGTKVLWQPEDKIKVFRLSDFKSLVFTSTNTEPAGVAGFVATGADAKSFFDGSMLVAVYPATEETVYNGSRIIAPIPSEQRGIAGTFDPAALVTYAISDSDQLFFKHRAGGIRFTLTQEGIDKVELNCFGAAGDAIIWPTNGSLNEKESIVLRPDSGYFQTGEWYYISMLPSNVINFTLTFYKDGKKDSFKLNNRSVPPGIVGSVPKIDKDLVFSRDPKEVLMDFYYAMDGPNWKEQVNWFTEPILEFWKGVYYNWRTDRISLRFSNFGLKGELPECLGELYNLESLTIMSEPGITGTLPKSFQNLKNLQSIWIQGTSMTSLPDVFADLDNLNYVVFLNNPDLTGPLPVSAGLKDNMINLDFTNNAFTGTAPGSWARHYKHLGLRGNRLSGAIPPEYLEGSRRQVAIKLESILSQKPGYGFDVSEIEMPGLWPGDIVYDDWGEVFDDLEEGIVEDLNGKTFTFEDIVSRNDYTVYLSWAPWCPFSKALMPQLRDYYKKYRQDGLEIIATVMYDQDQSPWTKVDEQIACIEENGYGEWFNFYFDPYRSMGHPTFTPAAEVYDRNGNVLFSYDRFYGPDSRNRFNHDASTDLLPFLESVLGPAEDPDVYASTDYSQDGKVITLQQATVGNGINIVFMGDAYTDKDMVPGGLYETTMKKAMEEFFAVEPYKTFRNRFNVYAVKAVSPNGRIGDGYTTAFSTCFGNDTYVNGNVDLCYEYALKVPGINSRNNLLVSVILNTRRHAGTAHMSGSTRSSVAFTPSYGEDGELMGGTLRHEAGGHGFAFLADEYFTSQASAPQAHMDDYNNKYKTMGWFANVDFTNDPAKIKWSAFLADDRYAGQVGIYEGAALYALGAYRPSWDSIMREQVEDSFNAPSRWAIYKRIMELSGESYSFQSFLEYDEVNRSAAAAPARRSPAVERRRALGHTAPPVIYP